MNKRIYLDYSATTPVEPRVMEAIAPYFSDVFGNPNSQHFYGREAMKGITIARKQVASAINAASATEIYFTSGGTESDNWAIKGVAEEYRHKGNHIITSAIEHPAVLNTLKSLEAKGYDVTYLPVDSDGLISLDDLRNAITDKTILITIMFANNEIGTVMPVAEIGAIAHERGVIFHTDAVQAGGSVPIDVQAMNIDLLSMSGHKIYAPKGIGAVYKSNRLKIAKFMNGGEQERGQRAGTLNSVGIVGLGAAIELAVSEMDKNTKHMRELRDYFVESVESRIDNVYYNGTRDVNKRLSGNANFSFEFIEGESLLLRLDLAGIAVSSGSACSSGSLEPSHVLLATGRAIELAHGSIRFSIGKLTTREDIDYTVDTLVSAVNALRELSPLFKEYKGDKIYV